MSNKSSKAPVVIQGTEYKSAAALKRTCAEVKSKYHIGEKPSDADTSFLMDVFSRHREYHEKLHCESPTPMLGYAKQGTIAWYLVCSDGTKECISIDTAANNAFGKPKLESDILYDFKSSAREVINSQIKEFKRASIGAGEIRSALTGLVLDANDVEIDHEAPNTFDNILFSFVKENEIAIGRVGIKYLGSGRVTFAKDSVTQQWAKFHKEKATLRIVSKEEHKALTKAQSKENDWYSVI